MKKNVKKTVRASALATGTILLSSVAGASQIQASSLFSYESLGSGSELRSELLAVNDATDFIKNNELELKCGEGKCGEGKCGDKKDAKASEKADKAAEHKCGEGKCGEGKCGEKKDAKPADKTEKAPEKKAAEKMQKKDD